jgi:hypothetical protein
MKFIRIIATIFSIGGAYSLYKIADGQLEFELFPFLIYLFATFYLVLQFWLLMQRQKEKNSKLEKE